MAQTHFGPVLGSSMFMCSYELHSIDLQGLVLLVSSFPSGYYTLSTFFFEGSPDLRGERFLSGVIGHKPQCPLRVQRERYSKEGDLEKFEGE